MGETRDEEENRLGERSDVQELGSAVEDLEIIRRRWKDGGDFLVLEVLHVCTEACEEGEIAFKLFERVLFWSCWQRLKTASSTSRRVASLTKTD